MKLGDKEVEYNPEFHFYITTRMSNPHYTPEISTKTAIVNFAVKEQGKSFIHAPDKLDIWNKRCEPMGFARNSDDVCSHFYCTFMSRKGQMFQA